MTTAAAMEKIILSVSPLLGAGYKYSYLLTYLPATTSYTITRFLLGLITTTFWPNMF